MARPSPSFARVPPQNIESEKAVLGSVMLRPEAIHEILDSVSPESFYAEKHRIIWEVMLELLGKNEPIDIVSLSSRLRERGLLEQVGGAGYLAEIVSIVPSAANIKYYGDTVYKKFVLRSLIHAAEEINELGYSEHEEIETLIDQAEQRLYTLSNSGGSRKFYAMKDMLVEAWERLERIHEKKDSLRGVSSGFKELDSMLSGFQKSDLIILAARPSVGKTALALDIARRTATEHNTAVCIFSLEMASQQLVDRMLAAESNVNAWHMRTGHLSRDEEFDRIRNSLDRLSKAPIFIDDQPGNNILKMRSVARRLKREKNLGLIIVDYLQLMTPINTKNSDSAVQQVTELSRSLKHLARELDVPVIALSQLSRAVEQRGGKPRLSDLRDSGCLTGDTLIQRADTGERVPIVSLLGQKDIPIVSLDASYELRPVLASRVFSSGKKQVFALTTRSGRSIKASGNHRFLTFEGWQRLDALQEGDRLALPRFLKAEAPQSALSVDELILLAHLLGDGCVLPRQPIHYTSADEKNLEAVEKAAHTLFGISARHVKQKNWWHSYLPSPYRLARGKRHPITEWYERMGILPVRSYEKRVPQAVFAADSKSIQLFLHHLWATDGNISWKRLPGRKPSAAIYYASSSKGLAQDVQHLLLRLGIWSSVREVLQGKHRPNYHVHIQSAPVQLRFLELVGSYGARGGLVSALREALRAIAPIPNTDTLPREVWELIGAEKERALMSWRGVADALDISFNGSALMATGVSRPRLGQLAKILGSEQLTHLAESDVYWDEVTSIEPLGVEEVFDMTVPGTHNFVAGDILVHNSIEQDADVVMFIHREDKNKDASERTNIAEILIEKHRNGPTGVVQLYFNADRSSYQSIDKSSFGDFADVATF